MRGFRIILWLFFARVVGRVTHSQTTTNTAIAERSGAGAGFGGGVVRWWNSAQPRGAGSERNAMERAYEPRA